MVKVDREKIWEYLLEKCDRYPGVYFDRLCFDFEISRTLAKKIVQKFIDETDRFIVVRKMKIIINIHPSEKSEEDILVEKLEELIKKETILINLYNEELEAFTKRIEQNEIMKDIPTCGCE